MVIGEAYKRGYFKDIRGGIAPKGFNSDRFYFFDAELVLKNPSEFESIVETLKLLMKEVEEQHISHAKCN